ncbi:MAG: hypothetical protein D6759_06325 [Chloroflexi bacterium]|nr:MAG: hypothetical protein D6759_06325 [Chloroflexota bacterium]
MRNVTRHSLMLIASFFVTAGLNYAFGVTLSWFFLPDQFGVLGVAQSLLLLTALVVGSGFAWTAAHDLAAEGPTARTRRRFRAAWTANVLLGLLLAAGLEGAYLLGMLPLGPSYRLIVPLVGLTTVLLAARAVINGAARGLYRFGPVALNLAGEVVVKVIVGLALVALGGGVTGVMVGFALGTALALAHSLWIVRPARLWRGAGWFDRQAVVATAPLFLGMLGPALMLNLDILGLKLLAPAGQGDAMAGLYQAAVILARTPVFVAQSLTLVLFSYVAGSRAGEKAGTTSRYREAAVRAWARLLLPAGLVLVLAPQTALTLLFPAHYRAAAPALRLAAVGGLLLALVTLLNGLFQAAGDRRRPALAAGLAIIAQVTVLVGLVPRWGTPGAALSLLVAGTVALVVLAPAILHRSAFPMRRLAIVPLVEGALPLLGLVLPLLLLPGGGRGAALAKLALAGLSYLTLLLLLRLRPAGRPHRPGVHPLVRLLQALVG